MTFTDMVATDLSPCWRRYSFLDVGSAFTEQHKERVKNKIPC